MQTHKQKKGEAMIRQKYQIIGVFFCVLFCMPSFSNTKSRQKIFNTQFLQFHPLQNPQSSGSGIEIRSLCPLDMEKWMCATKMSFASIYQTSASRSSSPRPSYDYQPVMLTPVMTQPEEISNQRKDQLLQGSGWDSYIYSNSTHRYESRKSKKEEITNSSWMYMKKNGSQVILEQQKKDGQRVIHLGQLQAIETSEFLTESLSRSKTSSGTLNPPILSPKTTDSTNIENKHPDQETSDDKIQTPSIVSSLTGNQVISVRPTSVIYSRAQKYPSCASLDGSNSTEASSMCIECLDNSSEKIAAQQFNTKFIHKLNVKICDLSGNNSVTDATISNFNNNCQPTLFQGFVKNLFCESCQENIPPALMLSMMSMENSGNCTTPGDDGKSFGPFQINTQFFNYSTQSSFFQRNAQDSCQSDDIQCLLKNPVVNLRASIKVLKEKYKAVNSGNNSSYSCKQRGSSLNNQQMDLWRKAVAAYNGGHKRIQNISKLVVGGRRNGFGQNEWNQMSEWEKIRSYYFSCNREKVGASCETRQKFESSISNLAHVEVILGASQNSGSSLFKSWNEYLSKQQSISQCSSSSN